MNIDIEKAAEEILAGNLIAFPTETVYGLGADATSDVACAKIYELKGRPSYNPLIVHIATIDDARKIALFNDMAETLANHFWPGPLTLVLPINPAAKIARTVTAGLSTLAMRIPSHPTALELIKKVERPIAAPSANPSGYISPTQAAHVRKNFPNLFVLEGSNSEYGLESTIIELTDKPIILRYGFITPEILSEVLRTKVDYAKGYEYIKAPGMLAKHYAPKAKLRLNATSLEKNEMGLGFGEANFHLNLSSSGSLIEAAANLYDMLQILDQKTDSIAVAKIPNEGIGLAINDKLMRASA